MNKRLLTVDDVAELLLSKFGIDVYEDGNVPAPEIDIAICEAQDAKTLKEVGGYLEKTLHPAQKYGMYKDLIDALKQGKMPE